MPLTQAFGGLNMRSSRHRSFFSVLMSGLLWATAALACTANDTLIIRLTSTPLPTPLPTALPFATKFKVGDPASVVSVSDFNTVPLGEDAVPARDGSVVFCQPSTAVEILDVSANRKDPNDKTIFYLVRCGARPGWIPEFKLSRFRNRDQAKVVGDASVFMFANQSVPAGNCKDGETVTVGAQNTNPNDPTDLEIYVTIRCEGGVSGFVLESALAKP
jgi:hypothetical protein